VANFEDKWEKLTALAGERELAELYRMTVRHFTQEEIFALTGRRPGPGMYEETFQKTEGWPALSRLMRVDQRTYLPDCMLTKVDRASMAVALEVRAPLLDHRLLEFAAGLPLSLKYAGGEGKVLLKRLLARYVPRELFIRPKMGFGAPVHQWLKGELKGLLLDCLAPERLKAEGRFDPVIVARMVGEHLSGKANHHYRLWNLMMWEMWRERWLG
jgi:asparagine synthase (glutamine-hydrolysing)